MKIIYVYNKNFYAAIKAAYMHLKLNIPEDIEHLNKIYNKEGEFFYLGLDENLNEVYLLYSKKNSYILENLLKGLAHMYRDEIKVINNENIK